MADFEPVELDFMYGGNTQAEGAKIVKTTEQIATAHAEATKMVNRHNAVVLELRKDLVELGVAYKQATTRQQKSEIFHSRRALRFPQAPPLLRNFPRERAPVGSDRRSSTPFRFAPCAGKSKQSH